MGYKIIWVFKIIKKIKNIGNIIKSDFWWYKLYIKNIKINTKYIIYKW